MPLDFERSFASHEKAKYWSSKNDKKPENVGKGSPNKYWFNCDKCGHEFQIRPCNITLKKQWCPYCTNKLLCNNHCDKCYNKSFASHEKAKHWSTKNMLSPREIFKCSNGEAWFDCNECKHTFKAKLVNIVFDKWCPYCSNRKLCNNNCDSCYNKSFASHEKAKYWSTKNTLDPRQAFKNASCSILFNCIVCNHEFSSKLNNITSNDNWCPYCAIPSKILCKNNCTKCFNMSFASHEKSKYWSNKNSISPREVRKCSNNTYIFNCHLCSNEFSTSLNNISAGKWCTICNYTTEKKLLEWLKNEYDVKYQVRVNWCRNPTTQCYLPYDFEINSKIIIELDGRQHFEQVSTWKSPEEHLIIDKYKIKCALENSKHIIHIYQEDVYHDKNNWSIKLKENIDELLTIVIPELRVIGINAEHFN